MRLFFLPLVFWEGPILGASLKERVPRDEAPKEDHEGERVEKASGTLQEALVCP